MNTKTLEPIEVSADGRPHRQFELTIRVSANDFEDVIREIGEAFDHIKKTRLQCNRIYAGGSSHTIELEHDPAMTSEEYYQQLDVYLARLREAKHA